MNRREFVSALGVLPFAAEAALTAQAVPAAEAARLRAAAASPFPVIDTHIHIFDKTRAGGMPYPRDMPGGGEPQQGFVALPGRFKLVASPFGVVGAIIVEASPRLEDNFWLLDVAKDNPIIVGLVGRIDPADAAFPKNLDRLVQNKLFLGIRQGQLQLGLDKPEYIANLKRLADADCSLDVDTPSLGITATEVLLKVLDKVPSLRLVMDHLPGLTYRLKEFSDRAAMQKYVEHLKELGKRPQVYIKLSEVVRAVRWESLDRPEHVQGVARRALVDLRGGPHHVRQRLAAERERRVQLVSQRHRRCARVRLEQEPDRDGEGVLEELHEAVPVGAARSEPASDLSAATPRRSTEGKVSQTGGHHEGRCRFECMRPPRALRGGGA